MRFLNSSVPRPSNSPELTATPSSASAWVMGCADSRPSRDTTWMMGRSNFFANSKSRSSWAGTAMMAPVP